MLLFWGTYFARNTLDNKLIRIDCFPHAQFIFISLTLLHAQLTRFGFIRTRAWWCPRRATAPCTCGAGPRRWVPVHVRFASVIARVPSYRTRMLMKTNTHAQMPRIITYNDSDPKHMKAYAASGNTTSARTGRDVSPIRAHAVESRSPWSPLLAPYAFLSFQIMHILPAFYVHACEAEDDHALNSHSRTHSILTEPHAVESHSPWSPLLTTYPFLTC